MPLLHIRPDRLIRNRSRRKRKQQSKAATRLVGQVADIRRITQRNAEGVGKTRGSTVDLLKQAQELTGMMANGKARSNGRRAR